MLDGAGGTWLLGKALEVSRAADTGLFQFEEVSEQTTDNDIVCTDVVLCGSNITFNILLLVFLTTEVVCRSSKGSEAETHPCRKNQKRHMHAAWNLEVQRMRKTFDSLAQT